jgi:hypothetical protein
MQPHTIEQFVGLIFGLTGIYLVARKFEPHFLDTPF